MTAPPVQELHAPGAHCRGACFRDNGRSKIPLDAEDTRLTTAALRTLGVNDREESPADRHHRLQRRYPEQRDNHAGPRTIPAPASASSPRSRCSAATRLSSPGSARMQERPIGPLAEALNALGGTVEFLGHSRLSPAQGQREDERGAGGHRRVREQPVHLLDPAGCSLCRA